MLHEKSLQSKIFTLQNEHKPMKMEPIIIMHIVLRWHFSV